MPKEQIPELTTDTRKLACYIAMVIRNALEDFHCEHLSDEQMKQLNPIIRNAVCTALHAFNNYERYPEARRFADYNSTMIPKYWKCPELLEGYVRMRERERPGVDTRVAAQDNPLGSSG